MKWTEIEWSEEDKTEKNYTMFDLYLFAQECLVVHTREWSEEMDGWVITAPEGIDPIYESIAECVEALRKREEAQ